MLLLTGFAEMFRHASRIIVVTVVSAGANFTDFTTLSQGFSVIFRDCVSLMSLTAVAQPSCATSSNNPMIFQ